jgi:hypothetical protein
LLHATTTGSDVEWFIEKEPIQRSGELVGQRVGVTGDHRVARPGTWAQPD